jgi:hypothetical protein
MNDLKKEKKSPEEIQNMNRSLMRKSINKDPIVIKIFNGGKLSFIGNKILHCLFC